MNTDTARVATPEGPVQSGRPVRTKRLTLAQLATEEALPTSIRDRVLAPNGEQVAVLAFQSSI
jgi:hypothetical protein